MDGINDEEEVGNVDSKHGSVSSECKREDWNREETEVEMLSIVRLMKLSKG